MTSMETVLSPSDTRITVNNLDCCSDYTFSVTAATIDFGDQSPARPFRTLPDLSGRKKDYDTSWCDHLYSETMHLHSVLS
jgi:hypothetical protein